MRYEGEQRRAAEEEVPGFAILSRRGHLREVDGRLRTHLGVERLPEVVGSVAELLEGSGFHRRPGADVWEHEGRLLRAGERPLEDGARLVWTQPLQGDEELIRRRVRYLGLASHDLRGSLANVRSYAALLLNGRIPLEPKAKRGLETILRNTDKALSFAQDFFDASRADLGMLACERERQALEPLLASAVEHNLEAAGAANVAMSLELPDGPLPEVDVDGGRVQHAVEAFLRHHLLRAKAGEQLRVRVRPEGSSLRVEVRRDGVPLSDEEAELTFAREERAFREKKLEDPLRLGLARQEVEALGGSVGVTTDAGGTTLFLTLPIALASSVGIQV
ncbi:sensor histidine kinase [Archangium violaceum]|uniref:sensor histidine kinase n=1 Tax=Archangium violaceum TaxID=83451 RepID=UPI001EF0A506|nr:HAMP domain-containing sensor histidine kinase [Archangium violaceum]